MVARPMVGSNLNISKVLLERTGVVVKGSRKKGIRIENVMPVGIRIP